MTYTIDHGSESSDGQPIQITGTAVGSADDLHTAVSGSSDLDEIYVLVNNTSASDVDVTVLFGGTGDSDKVVETIPTKSSKMVVPGMPLNNAKVVKAFGSVTNVLNALVKVGRTS